jgi:hypothetical protein
MKTNVLICVLVLFIIQIYGQSQGTYQLQRSNKCALVINGQTKQYPAYCTVIWLGNSGYDRQRAFFQWNLPDEVIPDGSDVVSARLYISHIRNLDGSVELHAGLFSLELDVETASAQTLWERTDYFTNHWDYYIGSATAENFIIDETFVDGSDFTDAIEQSLADDFFTLGIIDFNEVLQEYRYQTSNCDVELEIVFNRPPVNVTVDQKRSDEQTSIGTIGRWEGGLDFVDYSVPHPFTFYSGIPEVLQGMQILVQNPTEKYHQWEGVSDITNHHIFDIDLSFPNNLTSSFELTHNSIEIQNSMFSAPEYDIGTIEFKDPWLIDYQDPDYGYNERNRGMKDNGTDALIFKERPSPFYPDYTTSYNGDVYQGVFLNQDPQVTPTYYSVRVPLTQDIYLSQTGKTHRFYFQNWSTTDASLHQIGSNPPGYD